MTHRVKRLSEFRRTVWRSAPLSCPDCGSAMIERASRKAKIITPSSKPVWGCTSCPFETPAEKRRPRIESRQTSYGGFRYQSAFEAKVAQGLDFRVRSGELLRWRRQVKIPLELNGIKLCDYWIDFVAERKDGVVEYVEAKGFETEIWRLKWRMLEATMKNRPDVELVVVRKRI